MSEENLAPEMDAAPEAPVEEQAAPEQSPEEVKAAVQQALEKEYSIKVNGKEMKTKINLNDDARITKALQLEAAAQQAFQERAMTAKQLQEIQGEVNEFLQQFTQDPLSIILNPEFNISSEQKRQLAEAILREDLERSQKSPEQIEAEEIKKKYEAILKEKQELEDQRREEERMRLEQEAATELEKDIIDALDKGNLPQSEYMLQKMADLAYIAYANGVDLSVQDLIPFVKEQYKKDMVSMLGILPDEEIELFIGKDRIRQIRNKQIQSVKPKQNVVTNPLKTQDTGVSSKKEESESKKISAKEFFNSLRG